MATPGTKEASETADGPHLAQMYFHLLIKSIYFSVLAEWVRCRKECSSWASDVTGWNSETLGIPSRLSHLLCVSVRMEKTSSAPIVPGDTQCFSGPFSCQSGAMDLNCLTKTNRLGGEEVASSELWRCPASPLVVCPICLPPILHGVMSLALGQRGERVWRPRWWNPAFLV